MRRRNILFASVTVLALVAGLAVWLWPDGDVDATTSDADVPYLDSSGFPNTFERPAWTRSLQDDAEVVFGWLYVAVRERTGVRVYELATGAERWHYLHRGLVTTHVAAFDSSLTLLSANEVRVFDLDTGELLSTVPVSGGDRTATPISEREFLVLSNGKDAYRAYSTDGRQLWSREPAACATSTQAYYGYTYLVLESSCADRTVLHRVDKQSGAALESASLPNTAPPATSNPPVANELTEDTDSPILLTTRDHTVVPVTPFVLTPQPARPYPATAELFTVREGWCAYTTTPERTVTCYDEKTGAVREQPYDLTNDGDVDAPRVRVFPTEGELVAATTDTTSRWAPSVTTRARSCPA
jgi:hypothetical protein